jgi:alkanesulfonate monooxygenase SsuD/methylene tetrahydromethanopterin reductase-like flavin-dependent oxidoreductase (luciferase family)
MRFGLSYEISVPKPWSREAERQVFLDCLEQVRVADEVGFESVWAVEHHFFEEVSHSSAPEIFLTACAMQTEQIRIGTGITICVPEFNNPIKIAERVATMDILSGGRVDWGSGRSGTWYELGGFSVDPDETKKTWDEFVQMMPKMWTQDYFSWEGRCFSMPERPIIPKPYQKPHPPMWVAVTSPGTEVDAAVRGLGGLGLSWGGLKAHEQKITRYHDLIQSCDPVGEVVTDKFYTVNYMFCHEDDAYANRMGESMSDHVQYGTAQSVGTREATISRAYPDYTASLAGYNPASPSPTRAFIPEGLTVGDPDHIIEALKLWEATGADGVNFIINSHNVIPQQEVLDSLRMFARDVMPHFDPVARAKQTTEAGALA